MKKVYSLLAIGVCATATAFAAEPILEVQQLDNSKLTPRNMSVGERPSAEMILESIGIDLDNKIELSADAVQKLQQKVKKNTVRRNAEGTWTDLGPGIMTDGLLWSLLYTDGDMYSNKWYVGVEKYSEEDVFCIYQPYYYGIQNINTFMGGTVINYEPDKGAYFTATDQEWYIEAMDVNKVVPLSFYTGMNVLYSGIGHVYVISCDDVLEMGANVPATYGTLNNGVISLPKGTLFYWLPEYKGHEADVFGYKYDSSIQLPDGASATVKLTVPYCENPDPKDGYVVRFEANGNNIEETILGVYAGDWDLTDNVLEQFLADPNTTHAPYSIYKTAGLGFKVSGIIEKYNMYSFIAVCVDKDKNVVASAIDHFYVQPNDGAFWKTLEGKARIVDNIIAGYYSQYSNETLICDVQESTKTPGYYRIVNPYGGSWKYAETSTHSEDHTHYLYVNATDPNKVYIEESPLGYDAGDGCFRVNSLAYNYIQAGLTPKTEWYGKKSDTNISFPASTIVVSEKNYNNNAWYTTNKQGRLQIAIPRQAGVDGIVGDANEAQAEYFNLQGVRVANPVPGQMLIVRRGENVTKELIR